MVSLLSVAVIFTLSFELLSPKPGKPHPDNTMRDNARTINIYLIFFIAVHSSLLNYLDTLRPLGTAHFSTKDNKKSTISAKQVTKIVALIIIGGS